MSDPTWAVHGPPRITELTFANALSEGPRFFKGVEETGTIWKTLLSYGVDPSFALGHFWVESLFGTAGWNIWADPPLRSWGNILYVNSSLRDRAGVTEYKASNGYDYAAYPDWTTGVEDYCLLLGKYRDHSPDYRYGDTSIIKGATAKWMAKVPNSDQHLNYLEIVLSRMSRYDSRPDFEGDMFISFASGMVYTSSKRYEVKTGERWYPTAGGSVSYPIATGGKAVFLGQVHGSSWVAVQIRTGRFSPDGKTRPVVGYVPNFDAKRVTNA